MRKTSHDGIDATSITSGIENEIKKAGANISKIKKSSIKRKVQNFNHETDEGIIEPLLQLDKEKSEIANRSAKYLLNKSKTDSSYERINKNSDNFALSAKTISSPVSSTSKIINNSLKDQLSISYTSGSAPMHNHMNTNIFGTYDVSKGTMATKSPILVEIDGSKSGVYNPSPLIFTTAKIHTDSKSKLMEPVQTTPVPILSTIEGNIVKTLPNNTEQNISSFSIKSVELSMHKGSKSDANEQSTKGKSLISATVIPVSRKEEVDNTKGVTYLNECINKNTKELQLIHSSKDSIGTFNKNQSTSQLSNNSSKISLPSETNAVNFPGKNKKDDIGTDSSVIKFNIDSVPISTKSPTEAAVPTTNPMTLAEKTMSIDKNKILKMNEQFPLDLQHTTDSKPKNLKSPQAIHSDKKNYTVPTSNISPITNLVNEEKNSIPIKLTDPGSTAKASVNSVNKRLQRQKNASIDEINDTTAISSPVTIGKSNITHELDENMQKNEKLAANKVDYKSEGISSQEKISSDSKSTSLIAKSLVTTETTPLNKPSKCIVPTSTTKIKSTTGVLKLKPATFSTFVDVTKTLNQPTMVSTISDSKDNINLTSLITSTTSQSSSKTSNGNTSVMATVSKLDSNNLVSTSSKADLSVKCESSVAITTLPAYIVSTSKTKIGATLATSTLTSTTKSLTQKPFAEIVYTGNEREKNAKGAEKSDRSTFATSSNTTKHPNFSQQSKSKTDSFSKDGRA